MAARRSVGFTGMRLASASACLTHPKDEPMSLSSLETRVVQETAFAKILGLGTAVPAHSIAQCDAAVIAQQLKLTHRWNDALPALYRKSGVDRRGSVLLGPSGVPDILRQSFYQVASEVCPFGPTTSERMQEFSKQAGPMLERACSVAIDDAGVAASSVTHLVTVSCTGFFAPGVDVALIEALGLDSNIQRTHVGFMGCHGALNGIRVAKAIAESTPNAVVLLGAVELCSLHQQYTDDAQQLVANALFADGAAGLVIGSAGCGSEKQGLLRDTNLSQQPHWSIVSTLSKWIPNTTALMSWTIGDHGFRMTLDPQVPGIIEANLEGEIKEWLERQSLCISDIDSWAIHPGGPRIIQAAGKAMGLAALSLEASQSILASHGNMSSPTVLFILDKISNGSIKPNYCVLLAFGPGLCIEAVLLKSTTLAAPGSDVHFSD
jgi:predicted naringenin-chalcone synthase